MFIRKINRGPAKAGSVAGAVNVDGYVQFKVAGKMLYAHRLAVLWMEGTIHEDDFVDHKDGVRDNNVWTNLRLVTRIVNNRNKAMQKNNSSGTVGVSWDNSRQLWVAHIGVNGKNKRLGRFAHKEDAVLARLTAEKELNYWIDKARDCI